MNYPNITFKKIYEHDMDLLILEEFISDKNFAKLFLNKLGLNEDYTVISASHSLSDSNGESDITFVLQFPGRKIALLIEDKIDAQTMPKQSARYQIRGASGIARQEYDEYHVMLSAPESYLSEHRNDPNADYPHKISYEELLDYFHSQRSSRAAFKAAVVNFAITEKESGYQVQEVKSVTEFWANFRKFSQTHYPALVMVGSDSPKGASAAWPEFRTTLHNVKVIYKSQKGFVDLEFPGYGAKSDVLHKIVKSRLTPQMHICKTGKSASIRLENPLWALSFTETFEHHIPVVHEILQAVSVLCGLASSLDYYDLY